MILDHNDIDIIVIPEKKKIITFPKKSLNDNVYETQDRFFNFLSQKGTITRESIHSGNVYGSLEAEYPDAIQGNTTQLIIFTIGKFIEEEKPYMEREEHYENEFEQRMTDPGDEESTELGKVPHEVKKGSIDPNNVRQRQYISGGGGR